MEENSKPVALKWLHSPIQASLDFTATMSSRGEACAAHSIDTSATCSLEEGIQEHRNSPNDLSLAGLGGATRYV